MIMNYTEIKEVLAEQGDIITAYAKDESKANYTELGLAVRELNLVLTALHELSRLIEPKDFYATKNQIASLIALAKDIKRDMNQRHEKIKRAIIEISNERFNGELWREVLERAKRIEIY